MRIIFTGAPLLWTGIHAQSQWPDGVTLWGLARDLEGTKRTPQAAGESSPAASPGQLRLQPCAWQLNEPSQKCGNWSGVEQKEKRSIRWLLDRKAAGGNFPALQSTWLTKEQAAYWNCPMPPNLYIQLRLSPLLSKPPAPLQPNSQALHCTFSLKLLSIHKDRYL